MNAQGLQGLRVAILATNGFEETELVEPKKALEEAGARVLVVAPKSGSIYGMKHHDKAGEVKVDLDLPSAKSDEFDAVMLPGGALNADALRFEKEAQRFVQEVDHGGKPVAFICHAPWLLVSAGLTRGRTLTSYRRFRTTSRIRVVCGSIAKSCVIGIGSAAGSRTISQHSIKKWSRCSESAKDGRKQAKRDAEGSSRRVNLGWVDHKRRNEWLT